MVRSAARLLLVGLASLGALGGCDDDGTDVIQTPTLQLNPEAGFLFPKLALGEMAERQVEVLNVGSGELRIADIELRDASSAGEFTLWVEADGERRQNPRSLTVPANSSVILVVAYAAADEAVATDEGEVIFASNDPDRLDVVVPVTTGDSGAEIDVSPRTVDFGAVEAGEVGAEEITIGNNGLEDLVITRMSINGSADFGARLGERDLVLGEFAPITVPSGERVVVEVTYSPPTLGPDQGELQIESNDGVQPVFNVGLVANGAAACLRVVPESVEFGSALIVEGREVETPNVRALSVESCGSSPLRVGRIEFEGSNAFGLRAPLEPGEGGALIELPAATPGEPFPNEQLEVGFWPTDLAAYGGTMVLHSNAEGSPTRVQIFGRGVDNTCPIPAVTTEIYNVEPLDIITLDGTPSVDPGGEVREWRWTVVERPNGSVSQPAEGFENPRRPADTFIEDDVMTPTAQFFVDLAGRYVIELQVVDNLGQPSCDPVAVKQVIIEAVPEKDLHIQLVWATPDDPDETDNIGTDVDLHLRHENGGDAWGDDADGWDCYFANVDPDWGAEGDVADNPSLDIDDTNGAGPENVNLSRPEAGVAYDVGALYFRSESTFGVQGNDPRQEHTSYVTLRIFVRGELLFELVDRELSTLRQLWHVATVRWCDDLAACPDIVMVDEVLEEEDYARP